MPSLAPVLSCVEVGGGTAWILGMSSMSVLSERSCSRSVLGFVVSCPVRDSPLSLFSCCHCPAYM
eukprot:2730450-Pyramimonas_sp.AAC.1